MGEILGAASVCVLYLVTAKLGLAYTVVGQTVTLLWPPSGIALAGVLIGGYRVWPGIALGAFLANVGTGVPVPTLCLITLGNTLEPLWGAVLLRLRGDFSNGLDKLSDVFALILSAAVVSTMAGASLGSLGLLVGGEITVGDFPQTWLVWWLGDGLGVILISSALLTGVAAFRAGSGSLSRMKVLEALALLVGSTVVAQRVFGDPTLAGLGYFPVSLSMFPFAIWSGLRFGAIGASGNALIASLLAIHGTVQGTGPFAVESGMDSMIRWCLFADIVAITGLLLAAIRSEREKALASLRQSKHDLEWQVRKRTDELTRANRDLHVALAERHRLQLEMNQLSEERQKMMGQELHDGLGQQLTGISFLVASLRETLGARSVPEVGAVQQIEHLLSEVMGAIRSLARGLYPVTLETGGLTSALNHLAEHASSFSGVQCSVSCSANVNTIDKTTALNLYRIAQEAICNALRHSKAARIDIDLSALGEHYRLSIHDNGIGLDHGNLEAGASLGLRSMRNRADLIGARFTVQPNPAGGTSVVVTGRLDLEHLDVAN